MNRDYNCHLSEETNEVLYHLLLCWKTRIVAPDPRAPLTIELWFNESLIISPPCSLTSGQIFKHFLLNMQE